MSFTFDVGVILESYIRSGDDNRGNSLRNILHFIKSADQETIARKLGGIPAVSSLDEEQFHRACVAATFVQYACSRRRLSPPAWVTDAALRLDIPYFDQGCDTFATLLAPQACLDHNVFFDRSAMEVL